MAEYGGRFESGKAIEERREFKRRAREEIAAKARDKYEKEEKQKQLKRLRGEDTWMLPDVNERLEEFSKEHSVNSKKKKEKKSKKNKKEKKKKKLMEKTDEFSDSSSGSEVEWIEAATGSNPGSSKMPWKVKEEHLSSAEKTDTAQREEWMTLDFMSLKTVSTTAIRAGKLQEKEMEQEKVQAIEQAEIHKRELNPYWKDGGSGLPSEQSDSAPVQKAAMIEDGGLSWLRQSYKHMKEQAERDQCRLEDVIVARYGSMDVFQRKLQEAEKVAASKYQKGSDKNRRESWNKTRNWNSDQNDWKEYGSERKLSGDNDRYREGDRDTERERSKKSFQDQFKQNERKDITDRYRDRYKSSDREVEVEHGKDIYTDKSGEINRTREEKHKQRGQRNSSARGLESDHFHDREKEKSLSLNNLKSKFMKPVDIQSASSKWITSSLSSSNHTPEFHGCHSSFQEPDNDGDRISTWCRTNSGDKPPEEPTSLAPPSSVSEHEGTPKAKDKWTETKPRENSPVQAESSLDQQKSSLSSGAVQARCAASEEPVQPLSEEEMNKLGAKLIKAELMGNLELASKLKAQLEKARKLKIQGQNHITASKRTDNVAADENQEVILVRTDQSGRVWPVDASAESIMHKGGKKKRKTIETHHEGERIRYFQDDDNLSLQDLVRQEKMTSAEDQNERFSRMASKKAIMEADEEWSMNKKLVDLSARDIRRAVPKGLAYFSVDFGLKGGFAHVIENEVKFPFYFGKEIVGGMLDLEPRRWRKPIRENFDDQRKKVLQFSHWWKPYDCTKNKE
uniref:CWF19-like protein 2 n=1 Tax=Pristiophorus japonicus TaxID=55135 RepID=UPI00398EC46A